MEAKLLMLPDDLYKEFLEAAKHFHHTKNSGKVDFTSATKESMRMMIEKYRKETGEGPSHD